MSTPFPTRPHPGAENGLKQVTGKPRRALGCRCDHPLVADGECARCGRFCEPVIDETWAERAAVVGGKRAA